VRSHYLIYLRSDVPGHTLTAHIDTTEPFDRAALFGVAFICSSNVIATGGFDSCIVQDWTKAAVVPTAYIESVIHVNLDEIYRNKAASLVSLG
jgi:hypothetical protein